MKKGLIFGVAIIAATLTYRPAAAIAVGEPHPATPAVSAAGTVDVQAAMADRVLGEADAPVTVVEYASLTCTHCAHFATTILPEVKTRLVATGKLRIIYRDFPLDQLAMKAAKMARCAPKDRYFDLIEVLFRNRDRWIDNAKEPEKALMQLGALAGMDDATMKSCIANAEMDTALLTRMNEAQTKFSIQSTPSFVFDDGAEVISGAHPVEKFEEIVTRLSAAKKK